MSTEHAPQFSQAELQGIKGSHEALGIEFIADNAILRIPGKASIVIENSVLFDPSAKKLKEVTESINSLLGDDIEIFDPADAKYSYNVGELKVREIGRVFSHFEIQGPIWDLKKVNYYTYLRVEAESNVPDNTWEQIIQYVICVVAAIGLVVLLTMIPGGQVIIPSFAVIVGFLAAGCLVIVSGVSDTAKRNSYVNSFVGT